MVVQVDRVDDTGVWGWLVDWGRSFEAYLPIGSIGKEKGRGERKAQKHFLTTARRSLASKKGEGMTLVAFVQSVEAPSRTSVASTHLDIADPAFHLAVTRRGLTDEIEKEALDLSRDVQYCARLLVDKAAHAAGLPRRWARQATLYHAYEQALTSADNEEVEEEEEDENAIAKASVAFLVERIGGLACNSTQTVLGLLEIKSAGSIDDEKTNIFAARLLELCREEKVRRSKPVSITATAVIGGPKALVQQESLFRDATQSCLDVSHLLTAFRGIDEITPPVGCEPATISFKGNGKYVFVSAAPPALDQAANKYLCELVQRVQEAWVKSASSTEADADGGTCPSPEDKPKENHLQPTLNIGVIGDVANGKSTLVKAISGKRTQCHSTEQQQHGITIRLGFANAAVLRCQNAGICGCYSFLPESEDNGGGDGLAFPKCFKCGQATKVVKRFSLLDCPGHAELMATMLAGSSAFDAVLLAGAANLPCPTPQARQHLEAIKMSGIVDGQNGEPLVAIAQTKAELLADASKNAVSRWTPEERLENHASQGRENLKDSVAANAPIFPVCSPLGIGLEAIAEWIANLPDSCDISGSHKVATGPIANKPRMTVLRSFDVNRPGTKSSEMGGGVLGGTLVESGTISVGDSLEIRPGLCLPPKMIRSAKDVVSEKTSKKSSSSSKKYSVRPLRFRCTSLMTGKNDLSSVGKGGLVAVGTSLDSYLCADNRMVGSVVGPPGTLPPVWGPSLLLDRLRLVDLLPNGGSSTQGPNSVKLSDVLKNDTEIRCHVGSATLKGYVVKVSNKSRKLELLLDGPPVCALKGANVAIESRQGCGKSLALVAHGKLIDGGICLPGVDAVERCGEVCDVTDTDEEADSSQRYALFESDECHRKQFLEDLQIYKESQNGEYGVEGLSGNSRVSLPRVDVARDGGAHVLLSNFGIIAHSLRRDADHLVAFLEKEGGLTCVLAGNRSSPATTSLRVKWRGGRNFVERFESILKKYVKAFVTCNQCRGAVTELLGSGRNEQLCRRCNARRFVAKL